MHYGVAAAKQALADSGLEITDENREDVGVVFGSGGGGQQLFIDNLDVWDDRGARAVSPFFIANGLVDSTSGMIAIETGAIGHNMCVVTACSTGTHNVGEGAEAIRRGDCIAAITGSTEMPLLEVVHIGFGNMRGLGSPRPGESIETVCRPFDATRDGFVLGEGAGVAVPRGPRAREGARSADLRRGRRLRLGGRRLGHDPADRQRHRLGAGDEDGARSPRRPGRRGRPDQPPRHLDAARRQARGAGDLARVRRPHARASRSRARSR